MLLQVLGVIFPEGLLNMQAAAVIARISSSCDYAWSKPKNLWEDDWYECVK